MQSSGYAEYALESARGYGYSGLLGFRSEAYVDLALSSEKAELLESRVYSTSNAVDKAKYRVAIMNAWMREARKGADKSGGYITHLNRLKCTK